jgi:hypothetical protein
VGKGKAAFLGLVFSKLRAKMFSVNFTMKAFKDG